MRYSNREDDIQSYENVWNRIMTLIQTGLYLKGGFVPSEQHVQSIYSTCKSRTHSCPRMDKLSQIRKKREYIVYIFVVFPNILSSLEVFLWMCGNLFHFNLR